jgi:hypothetical protein
MIIQTATQMGHSQIYEVADKVMLMTNMGNNMFSDTGVPAYSHLDGYELDEPTIKDTCRACGSNSGTLKFRRCLICPSCKRAWLTRENKSGMIIVWRRFLSGR